MIGDGGILFREGLKDLGEGEGGVLWVCGVEGWYGEVTLPLLVFSMELDISANKGLFNLQPRRGVIR